MSKIIFFVLFLSSHLLAQPYAYYGKKVTIDSAGQEIIIPADSIGEDTWYQLFRVNLATKTTEEFLPDVGLSYIHPVWDQQQSYLFLRGGQYDTPKMFDLLNLSKSYEFEELSEMEVKQILYSSNKKILYIFFEDGHFFTSHIKVYDLNSEQTISTITVDNLGEGNSLMFPRRNAFFSSDESKIYFYCRDSLTRDDQVWTLSTDNNEIINKENLSILGYPGMDGYELSFGIKGKGIISSYSAYNNPVKSYYYQIYDFDADSGFTTIHQDTLSEGYFTTDGKYLILMKTTLDSTTYDHTGKIQVFDSHSGKRILDFNYPFGGIIYSYNNLPNILYYLIDNENSPIVYQLDVDSILNEQQETRGKSR